MIRQYKAQRFKGGQNPLRIGVIPVGAIFYLQDDHWWRERYRGKPICREPWIVTAFLNGTMGSIPPQPRRPDTGRALTYRAGLIWHSSAHSAMVACSGSPFGPSFFTTTKVSRWRIARLFDVSGEG